MQEREQLLQMCATPLFKEEIRDLRNGQAFAFRDSASGVTFLACRSNNMVAVLFPGDKRAVVYSLAEFRSWRKTRCSGLDFQTDRGRYFVHVSLSKLFTALGQILNDCEHCTTLPIGSPLPDVDISRRRWG